MSGFFFRDSWCEVRVKTPANPETASNMDSWCGEVWVQTPANPKLLVLDIKPFCLDIHCLAQCQGKVHPRGGLLLTKRPVHCSH